MNALKENEYKCAYCHGVFEKGWSDEEAQTEAEVTFGKPVKDWKNEAALVCEDCYQKMLPSNHPNLVAEAKKHL